jgi:transcriptional regulator with XRE-family HTH domain
MNTPHPGLALAVKGAGSLRKLADKAGCTHGALSYYWRNGKPLSAELAAKVSKAVGIKASLLTKK